VPRVKRSIENLGTYAAKVNFVHQRLDNKRLFMPLVRRKALRQGRVPMIYFKGNPRELKEIGPVAIRDTLKSADVILSKTRAKKMRKDIRALVKTLKPSSSTTYTLFIGEDAIPIHISKSRRGRLLIRQQPLVHGVRIARSDSFTNLMGVLSTEFRGSRTVNSTIFPKRQRRVGWSDQSLIEGVTYGDAYAIEFMAPAKPVLYWRESEARFRNSGMTQLDRAKAQQILSINIRLSSHQPQERINEKKRFYRAEIQKRHGIPVKFVPNFN
jgi:hypothetical protein